MFSTLIKAALFSVGRGGQFAVGGGQSPGASGLFLAEIVLPGVARSVAVARRCVGEVLMVAGHADVNAVRLVVSELVTNAVSHSASAEAGGFVTVEVTSLDIATAYIEVIDDGTAMTFPEVRNADAGDCGGRGLWLVETYRPDGACAMRATDGEWYGRRCPQRTTRPPVRQGRECAR
ncbi:ATP-binding protein [Nonomuraea sp. NPDC052129]|uniref:ATP-binding protein n=1 Tax=Nonomuraea sp. NPDC052129 TaxID=3154651 RepID=UPI003426578E